MWELVISALVFALGAWIMGALAALALHLVCRRLVTTPPKDCERCHQARKAFEGELAEAFAIKRVWWTALAKYALLGPIGLALVVMMWHPCPDQRNR